MTSKQQGRLKQVDDIIKPGDIVWHKWYQATGEVIEVAAGGARLRYEPGGPFGERGRRLGVWEHLVDLELVRKVA